jgi:hypothetical protein
MKKMLFIALAMVILSCSDDNTTSTGSIVFEFDSRAGEDQFAFGTTYQNELDQDFSLSKLTYTISRVRLRKTDGTFVADPSNGIYIINDSEEISTLLKLTDIPAGKYDAVEFTIGGENTYFEIAGTSSVSAEEDDFIGYEVSGISNQKTRLVEFHDHIAVIKHTAEPEVHLVIDVLKFFTGTTDIDFETTPVCETANCVSTIADNYAGTFVFDHIHQ